MEKSIQRSIEGGFLEIKENEGRYDFIKGFEQLHVYLESSSEYVAHSFSEILLRPDFWQALGKAEGWEKNDYCDNCEASIEGWKYHWHNLICHIMEGRDINSFFDNLIKP